MHVDEARLRLTVTLGADADAAELAATTRELREELLELDVSDVKRPIGPPAPDGARAADAELLGTLLVALSQETLGVVLHAIGDWLTRKRTGAQADVEVVFGEDSIKLSNVSAAERERLIDQFLARADATRG